MVSTSVLAPRATSPVACLASCTLRHPVAHCKRHQLAKVVKRRATTVAVFKPSSAGPSSEPPAKAARVATTRLGELFLRLFPGQFYYLPCMLYPIATLAAGLGAVYAPTALQYLAGTPVVQALGPLAPLLHQLSTTQPWATLLCVLGSLITALLSFIAIPSLDFLLGRDLRNPTQDEAVAEAQNALFRGVLYAYCAVHLGMLVVMCHILSTTSIMPVAFLGATLSAGVAGGVLFSTAHELVHGCTWVDRAAANALLLAVGYAHWSESHLAHHVKVATPEDPASARRGESLYRFIPRSVWGNLVDGYSAEARRLKRRGIPLLSTKNRMLWWLGGPTFLAASVFFAFGWKGLAFAVGQAVISIIMLETVNYIEHYGLQRIKGADGKYERVDVQHSWNTSYMATSAVTFKLQRHADHHVHGTRPYQMLCDIEESPQLPFSYPVAMMLAALPPLFFSVMHPRIDAYTAAREAAQAVH